MAAWAVVVNGILFLIAVLMAILLFYINQVLLQKSNEQNIIYTFMAGANNASGTLGNETSVNLTCPVGSTINIIDAWYETYDPNFQCTTNPTPASPALKTSSNNVTLDFPPQYKNEMKQWQDLPICTGSSKTEGIDSSIWQPVTDSNGDIQSYQNLICAYDATGAPIMSGGQVTSKCLSMNALQYAINYANGANSFTLSATPGDMLPSPCTSDVTGGCTDELPIGGVFLNNTPDTSDAAAGGYQGFYLHGAYTCV